MKTITLIIMEEDEIVKTTFDSKEKKTIFHYKPSQKEMCRRVAKLPDNVKGAASDLMSDFFQSVTNKLYDENRRRCKIIQ